MTPDWVHGIAIKVQSSKIWNKSPTISRFQHCVGSKCNKIGEKTSYLENKFSISRIKMVRLCAKLWSLAIKVQEKILSIKFLSKFQEFLLLKIYFTTNENVSRATLKYQSKASVETKFLWIVYNMRLVAFSTFAADSNGSLLSETKAELNCIFSNFVRETRSGKFRNNLK